MRKCCEYCKYHYCIRGVDGPLFFCAVGIRIGIAQRLMGCPYFKPKEVE